MAGEPLTSLADQPLTHGFWGSFFTRGSIGAAILASIAWLVNLMWGIGKQKVEKWDKAADEVPALRQHVDDELKAVNARIDSNYQAINGKLDLMVSLLGGKSDTPPHA